MLFNHTLLWNLNTKYFYTAVTNAVINKFLPVIAVIPISSLLIVHIIMTVNDVDS